MNTQLDFSRFFPCVLQAVATDDFQVYVYFNDGSVRLLDAKPLLQPGTVFAPLRDIAVFKDTLTVLNDTVAWDLSGKRDGADCLDLDPETLFALPAVSEELWDTAQ